MASLGPIELPCPHCGHTIVIDVTATPEAPREDGVPFLRIAIDEEAIINHIAQHHT